MKHTQNLITVLSNDIRTFIKRFGLCLPLYFLLSECFLLSKCVFANVLKGFPNYALLQEFFFNRLTGPTMLLIYPILKSMCAPSYFIASLRTRRKSNTSLEQSVDFYTNGFFHSQDVFVIHNCYQELRRNAIAGKIIFLQLMLTFPEFFGDQANDIFVIQVFFYDHGNRKKWNRIPQRKL